MNNKVRVVKILDEKIESKHVKTIWFHHDEPVNPGQFYMIWIPGVDEIPMSVSFIQEEKKGITFRIVGDATQALFNKKPTDSIGVRGPYGNGFSLDGEQLLFVAGGTGIAMIAPAVETAVKQKKQVIVILGAKTKEDLFFIDRIKHTGVSVHVTTDDGSLGFQGYATKQAELLLQKTSFDAVYTCGPEVMMKKLYQICDEKDIIFEASLERYMKCGVGLCGQCVVGKGRRVCVEGPIFNTDQLKKIPDFGVFTRDASGIKKFIQ
ncbi:MAG: dihydroorotate dehydrogenase electron transfer subunit [Candidatus Thermoplasmatota archaeon]|nr:dihydroorotate dehydrogenase electron transfer subunit [Candidatus Thermoplasmatota archaeon]